MLFRADHPVSVGMLEWPHRSSRRTLVVKVAFRAGLAGGFAELADAVPIAVDALGKGGVVVTPSDFVPYKPRCDVVLVGACVEADSRSALLATHPLGGRGGGLVLRRRGRDARSFAARTTFGALADPSDPATARLWGRPDFDFERFQCAPPEQRGPFPSGKLAVAIEIDGASFGVTLLIGIRAACIDGRIERPIEMRPDTIALDPLRGCGTVTYRGVADFTREGTPSLAIATRDDTVPSVLRRASTGFVDGVAIEPHLLRALAGDDVETPTPMVRNVSKTIKLLARSPGKTARMPQPAPLRTVIEDPTTEKTDVEEALSDSDVITDDTPPSIEDELERLETLTLQRAAITVEDESTLDRTAEGLDQPSASFALPFEQRREPPALDPRETLTITTEPDARAALPFVARPPAPAQAAARPRRVDRSALPFTPATASSASSSEAPPPPRVRLPSVPAPSAPKPDASPLAVPLPPRPRPVPEAAVPASREREPRSLGKDEVASIKRELFAAPDQRRAILKRHGLSALEWRVAERSIAE